MSEFNADFSGEITLDVRDSRPDWSPYELRKAPDGAPNVLVVLYDDTGLASWSPYGGRIAMPTMDRLAAGASPTRSGTPRRCARRRGPPCSRGATTTSIAPA